MDKSMLENLTKGQQVAAAGAVTGLVAAFLPWYVLKEQFIDSVSFRGTEFTFGWMGLVLLLAAAGLVIAPAFGKNVGNDQIKGEQIAIGAAALGTLLWLVRIVQVPALFFGVMGRGIGLYAAAAAAAAVIAGVVMTMKEKDIAMPKLGDFKSIKDGVAASPTAQPAVAQPVHQMPAPQQAPVQQMPAPVQKDAAPRPAPQQHPAPQAAPVQQHAAPRPAPATRTVQQQAPERRQDGFTF